MADDADEYGEDEYEPESPVARVASSPHSEPSPPPVASPTPFRVASDSDNDVHRLPPPVPSGSEHHQQRSLLLDESASDGDKQTAAVSPSPRSSSMRRASGRHLLTNAAWTYSIEATRVRALKVPIGDSPALRDLRVFAVIDKQARQSRGSLWKADAMRGARRPSLLSVGSGRSLASAPSTGHRQGRSSSSSPDGRPGLAPGRRSGLLEEAKWTSGDGALKWTLPMDKFRQLKAYNPRIKVFLYGVGTGDSATSRLSPRRTSESEAADILSFGWFFLDLRTPDLPLRWVKLQNARYGGEIQIRSSLSAFAAPAEPAGFSSTSNSKRPAPSRSKASSPRPTEAVAVNRRAFIPPTPQPLPQEIVTDDVGDFLQLGARNGTDVFIVSVCITGARNLAPLVRHALAGNDLDEVTTAASAGFWLSYSLFDVVVQTDVFHNLESAEFPPIRDSFRVRSCLDDLRAFIDASHGGLPVFLCTENQIVAGITIPLSDLLASELFACGSKDREQQLPAPGTTGKVGERFFFPECEAASVSASVSIEYVGPATTVLKDEERVYLEGDVISSQPEPDNLEDSSQVASPAPYLTPMTTARVSVALVRLSNALLMPLVGSDGVTALISLSGSQSTDSLQFCGFESAFTVARLCRSFVVDAIDLSDRDSSRCHLQLTASRTQRCLAEATVDLSEMVGADTDGEKKTRVVSLRDESGRPAGECVLRLQVSSTAHELEGEVDDLEAQGEPRHSFRLSLQVKAVRDVSTAGTYTISFEHPFHKGIRAQSQPLAVPAKRETSVRDAAYCASDRLATLSELKSVMDDTVAIEFTPIGGRDSNGGGGVAAFSLNYLFYSEERFSCPDAECRGTFPTDEDALGHYREAHAGDSSNSAVLKVASIKSCSIYVPIVRNDSSERDGSRPQAGQRVGMVRIDAALEDFGSSTTELSDVSPQLTLVPELSAFKLQAVESLASPPPQETRQQHVTSQPSIASNAPPSIAPLPPSHPSPEVHFDRIAEQEEEQGRRLAQQAREWKQQLAEAERVRMDELEHEWARREEERAELLRAAQREYERLELQLRDTLADVQVRERRLSVAEASLEREQRAQRDEMDALRKRLASEQAHAVSLATQQREALAQRVSQLESQLAEAEQRAREVERDYAEYRRQQRKVPEARLREEIAALRGKIAELERQKLAEERAKLEAVDAAARLRLQLETANLAVQEERKKHEMHVVEELEKLRLKYLAREEKYVLDGDREELRAIKRQLDELRGIHERTGAGGVDDEDAHEPVSRKQWSPMKDPRPTRSQHPRRVKSSRRQHSSGLVEYHDDGAGGGRLGTREEDQQSRRSSAVSSDRGASLDPRGERRIHSRRRQVRPVESTRRVRVSSELGSSSEASFDAPKVSDGEDYDVEEEEFASVRSYSSSQSENAVPTEQVHVFSSSAAIASVASAAMNVVGSAGGSMEHEIKRLQRERELLLSSGTYNSKSYLVRELDRLIATARGKMRL